MSPVLENPPLKAARGISIRASTFRETLRIVNVVGLKETGCHRQSKTILRTKTPIGPVMRSGSGHKQYRFWFIWSIVLVSGVIHPTTRLNYLIVYDVEPSDKLGTLKSDKG